MHMHQDKDAKQEKKDRLFVFMSTYSICCSWIYPTTFFLHFIFIDFVVVLFSSHYCGKMLFFSTFFFLLSLSCATQTNRMHNMLAAYLQNGTPSLLLFGIHIFGWHAIPIHTAHTVGVRHWRFKWENALFPTFLLCCIFLFFQLHKFVSFCIYKIVCCYAFFRSALSLHFLLFQLAFAIFLSLFCYVCVCLAPHFI